MSGSLRQWESDPLFSAAEVVQDSADRMDSIFRIFLHDQTLVQVDQKLHRRDLVTALGTTKWQLEDFERAVNQSMDRSNTRDDAIFRHNHFIRAIEEQISQVERHLEERNTQWMNLNETDRDGLASFLSGGHPVSNAAQGSTENSIMRRFFDSSEVAENSGDCGGVELKTEEVEEPRVNGVMHVDRGCDDFKMATLRKVGSKYYTRPGFGTSVTIGAGGWEHGNPNRNAKSDFWKNNLRGSRNGLDVFGFLSNVWSWVGKMVSASAKRRNDKEVRKGLDQSLSSAYVDILQAEQGFTMQSCSWGGGYRRGHQWRRCQSKIFFLLAWAVIFILFVVGIAVVALAWDMFRYV